MAVEANLDAIGSGYNLSKINGNFQKIATALEDAVSLSGSLPNAMQTDLDLNSNDIINGGIGNFENLIVDGTDVHDIVGPPGPPGVDGINGTNGAAGAAATITIGTTTTLNAGSPATATNVGTSSAAVIDFGIPKGVDGDGAGDVVGPASAIDSNLVSFNTTTGKLIKDSGKAAPSGTIVGTTDTQSLTNKKLGSLTTNGFVKTSGGDGSLSVDTSTYLTTTTAASTYQPLDSDLTAIAALTTTSYGRALLALANQAALMALLDIATAADIRAGTAGKIATADAEISAMAYVTITDAATLVVDHAAGVNRTVTLGGNRNFGAPSNGKVGLPLNIWVVQDATGTRVPTWDSAYDFGDFGTPVLSTGANQADLLTFTCLTTGKFAFLGIRKRVD